MADVGALDPPIDADVEFETVGFDYGFVVAEGETIVAVEEVVCVVLVGTDATPAARLIGSAQIAASRSTGAPAAMVLQLIGGMLTGVTYGLQCVARTSDGQKLSIRCQAQCVGSY